jgi:transposase
MQTSSLIPTTCSTYFWTGPKQIGGYRRALLEPYEQALKTQLSDHPSMTLKELQAWLASEQSLTISISAIDKFVRQQLDYRYKKNRICQ